MVQVLGEFTNIVQVVPLRRKDAKFAIIDYREHAAIFFCNEKGELRDVANLPYSETMLLQWEERSDVSSEDSDESSYEKSPTNLGVLMDQAICISSNGDLCYANEDNLCFYYVDEDRFEHISLEDFVDNPFVDVRVIFFDEGLLELSMYEEDKFLGSYLIDMETGEKEERASVLTNPYDPCWYVNDEGFVVHINKEGLPLKGKKIHFVGENKVVTKDSIYRLYDLDEETEIYHGEARPQPVDDKIVLLKGREISVGKKKKRVIDANSIANSGRLVVIYNNTHAELLSLDNDII